MARVNPDKVVADMVDATSFPSLSDRFEVTGVPLTVVNGTARQVGAAPEARLTALIQQHFPS